MSSILTSDKLIKSIKRRGFIPRDQVTFTDDDFLEMATEEITIGIMESIIDARGDYLVYHVDIPMIDGINKYDIPARAHGNKLRDASINLATDPEIVVFDLNQVAIEDLSDIQNYSSYNLQTLFYLENNKVVISPNMVNTANVIRMYFYMRPNKLVVNKRAGVITTITDSTEIISLVSTPVKIVTFSTIPSHFSGSIQYDITSHVSPNKILDFDLNPFSVSTALKSITFIASDLPETISIGDYVTQSEETIVPNIPTEYHPIVAQRTVRACMEALNDDAGFAKASAKLTEMEMAVLKIVTNRVEGAPKKIKNRQGTLRQSVNKTYRRW